MKVTKTQLRQIIKEELAAVLREEDKPEFEQGDSEETIKVKKDGKWVDTGEPGEKITVKKEKEEEKKVDESRRRKLRKTRRK